MRFFNTEGPVRPDEHYAIPPLARGNKGEILRLIRAKRYFVQPWLVNALCAGACFDNEAGRDRSRTIDEARSTDQITVWTM